MKKTDLPFLPEFFDRYIFLVPEDIHLVDGLQKSKFDLQEIQPNLEKFQDFRYAPEKWTPKDILQHIIDCERIMIYRALAFSRGDKNMLHGFDEMLYAKNANSSARTIQDLLNEFHLLRDSSILFFNNLTEAMLLREGIVYGTKNTALALGFVVIGHVKHHINVLHDRYFMT